MESICKFIAPQTIPDVIQTVDFVLETTGVEEKEKISAIYRVNCVINGCGYVVQNGVKKKVEKGDVFFIFPACSYQIVGEDEFSYAYISFMGLRANVLMERFSINKQNFVFTNVDNACELFLKTLSFTQNVLDIASESLILKILSIIGKNSVDNKIENNNTDKLLMIKKFIDDNFSNSELNLKRVAKEFSYNPKYVSTVFKRQFKVGLSEYISIVRINQACILMDKRFSSVSDVAYLCGFTDSAYFSRVFKDRIGISPKEYVKRVNQG